MICYPALQHWSKEVMTSRRARVLRATASWNWTALGIRWETCSSEEGGVMGKRQERWGEGFVPGSARRRLLTIVVVTMLRNPLGKMTVSQHIQYSRLHPPVHLRWRPLCAPKGENGALLAHMLFGLPSQTDGWRYFHNSAIVYGCSVKEQVFF